MTTIETPPTTDITNTERTALTDAAKIIQGGNARASWRVSGDNLQTNLRHCTPAKKELVIWAFQWCIQRNIFLDDFASQVGYDSKTIDKIITGTYRNPRSQDLYDIPDTLAKGIETFRKQQLASAQLGDIDFVLTPSAKKIHTLCDLVRESHTPGFLFGASHIGKTWALKNYAIQNNHGSTPMVTVPANSGLGGLIKAIAIKLGVSTKGNTADTTDRIKGALASNMVLILDEVHRLIYTYRKEAFFASLEAIRDIYDDTQCGMVISTTNVFGNRMMQERKGALEQIFRRGVHRRQLGNTVRVEDAKPILKHHGLDWPEKGLAFEFEGLPAPEKPFEILRSLSHDSGLKAITERIRYARKFAAKEKVPVNWKHWTRAHLTIDAAATMPEDDWK
jgi:DNA transposition AAA+ family ATPase